MGSIRRKTSRGSWPRSPAGRRTWCSAPGPVRARCRSRDATPTGSRPPSPRIGDCVVPDAQTGFRALARRAAELVRPRETRYDFEAAFLLEALTRGLRVRSVPIATVYAGRPSHFRHWEDTWRLARVFTRYGRRIIFGAR